jgi:hypothetical protein
VLQFTHAWETGKNRLSTKRDGSGAFLQHGSQQKANE